MTATKLVVAPGTMNSSRIMALEGCTILPVDGLGAGLEVEEEGSKRLEPEGG